MKLSTKSNPIKLKLIPVWWVSIYTASGSGRPCSKCCQYAKVMPLLEVMPVGDKCRSVVCKQAQQRASSVADPQPTDDWGLNSWLFFASVMLCGGAKAGLVTAYRLTSHASSPQKFRFGLGWFEAWFSERKKLRSSELDVPRKKNLEFRVLKAGVQVFEDTVQKKLGFGCLQA